MSEPFTKQSIWGWMWRMYRHTLHIGRYINDDMGYKQYSAYGSKILATLSQRLTARYGKGYTYSAVTRMMKVARYYRDEETNCYVILVTNKLE